MTTHEAGRLAARVQRNLVRHLCEDWTRTARAVLAELRRQPIRQLVEVERVRASVTAALSRPTVAQATRPALRQALRLALARVHARAEPAAEFVPARARELLDELVAHPEVVSDALIAEVVRDPAVEAVLHEVLFEALRQFAESTNPFTADWGLPALLERLPPFGRGPLQSAMKSMRADFEKRLEPEIRKFTASFSQRAVQRVTELSLRKQREPEFVALRQRIVAALLKRPLAELVWAPADPRGRLLVDVVDEIVGHVLVQGVIEAEAEELLGAALDAHGDQTLGEVLDEWGIDLPDVGAVTEAYQPAITAVLQSAAFGDALTRALEEALAEPG